MSGSLTQKVVSSGVAETTMVYFEVMPSQLLLRWGLEELLLRKVKASVVNAVGKDDVSTKTTSLERKADYVYEVVLHMTVSSCL